MPKRLFALLLVACLLCGCGARVWDGDSGITADDPPESHRPFVLPDLGGGETPSYGGLWGAEAGRTAVQRRYGSATQLGWPAVLVSIYLDDAAGHTWTEEAIARTRQNLALAVDWIDGQCAQYGVAAQLHYDDGTPDNGLFYRETWPGRFAGGVESDEGEDFYAGVEELCAALDDDALHQRYGTASVGFLFFLPVEGVSFTMVHYLEDGSDYYHEYCCLYQYDAYDDPGVYETPAVYAHEILHLFGAPDLYPGSSDRFVDDELVDFVAETWPDSIMLDTYGPGGENVPDRIDKILCPLTAYRLGLCTGFEGMGRFPAVAVDPPGTFAMQDGIAAALPAWEQAA